MSQDALIILGAGYVARFMPQPVCGPYRDVRFTSRDPDRHLTDVPLSQRVRFDLADAGTWKNIPDGIDVLWCFPAAPPQAVQQFAAAIHHASRRLVVLGSTSAYAMKRSPDHPPPWIDESSPIDLAQPRVQAEEFLRRECGATVLRVAGIYGPGRNPLDWIRSGRVGPSEKYVNLVHVEDLAAICLAALARGKAGEVYNVSDGTARTWNEIYRVGQDRWQLPPIPERPARENGKRIETRKLREGLGATLRHSDFFAALDQLERSSATTVATPSRQDRPADC